jgi:hypothetical protein
MREKKFRFVINFQPILKNLARAGAARPESIFRRCRRRATLNEKLTILNDSWWQIRWQQTYVNLWLNNQIIERGCHCELLSFCVVLSYYHLCLSLVPNLKRMKRRTKNKNNYRVSIWWQHPIIPLDDNLIIL